MFGFFVVRKRGERVGRNPKAGEQVSPACSAGLTKNFDVFFANHSAASPLRRPAPLMAARFGPAPPSCDRIDDHSIRVRARAVAIAWGTISGVRSWALAIAIAGSGVSWVGCYAISIARRAIRPVRPSFVAIARRGIGGYRRTQRLGLDSRGRCSDICLLGDRRRHSDVHLLGYWYSDIRPGSSSPVVVRSRTDCPCRDSTTAISTPLNSAVDARNARCRKRASDFGFGRVERQRWRPG